MEKLKALIPLDGSDFSQQILGTVFKLIKPEHYSLTLLRVALAPQGFHNIPAVPVAYDGSSRLVYDYERSADADLAKHPIFDSQVVENLRTEMADSLREDVAALKEAGFDTRIVIRFGEAAKEIIGFVKESDIDLVLMATHGRSGLSRTLMGSVAETVLKKLNIPVMMLRPTLKLEPEPLTALKPEALAI